MAKKEEASSQWELSKENIQPLKQGRKATVLSVALDENSTQKLNVIRHEFEEELRMYSGDDPLDVWYRYALWVEQNYPKGGKEGNLKKLIEKCVTAIHGNTETNEKYKNEPRILDLWIKYANLSQHPLEIYQTVEKKGLCTSLADFYVSWSWELEKIGSYRQADTIYQKGLQMAAGPINVLQEGYKKFQTRVARSTLEGNLVSQGADGSEPHRVALTALKLQCRSNRVATDRVGAAVVGPAGRVHQNQVKGNARGPVFAIFQDGGVEHGSAPVKKVEDKGGAIPVGDKINQENIKKAGHWTKAKASQKTVGVVPLEDVDKIQKPSFSVHEDEKVPVPLHTPAKLPQTSNVLSTRKSDFGDWHVELFIAELFNPKVQPQYCKHKVYCGTEEFSFEEIRAAKFFKKQREDKQKKEELDEMKDMIKKQSEMIEMLLQQKMSKQESKPVPQLHVSPPSPPLVTHPSHRPGQKMENSNRNVFQDSWIAINKSVNVSVNASHLLDESSTRALLQCQPETACLSSKESSIVQDPTPAKATSSLVQDNFNLSTTSRSLNMSDPTMETKKALKAMDDMFSQSFFNGDNQQEASGLCLGSASEPLKDNTPFSIFQDGSGTRSQEHKEEKSVPFQIYSDENKEEKSVPFQIYTDDLQEPSIAELPYIQQRSGATSLKECVSEDPNDQYPETQDENCPPAGVVQERQTRPISGVLQPATGIRFQPLDQREEQDQMEDLDCKRAEGRPEISDELEDIVPLEGTMGDFTLKMPCDLEAFSKHAKVASTPAPWTLGQPSEEPEVFFGTNNNHFPLIKGSDDEEEKKENSGDLMPPPPLQAALIPPVSPAHITAKTGLSPIMEASREYISSSSSSGHSSTTLGGHSVYGVAHHGGFSTSSHVSRSRHNSNTQPESGHETGLSTQGDFTKSGYLADKSRGESMADSKPCITTSQIGHRKEEEDDALSFSNQAEDMLMDMNSLIHPPVAPVTRAESKGPKTGKPAFPENINPFAEEILDIVLSKLKEPLHRRGGYVKLKGNLPPVKINSQVTLGRELFHIHRVRGEGAYALAYLASTMDPLNVTIMPTNDSDEEDEAKQIILKVQKPSCPWEFYICHELRERLKTRMKSPAIIDSVLRINRGYFSANQSVLVNQYHKYGTLLDAVNGYRTGGQTMPELIAMYWMVEVLAILEAVHKCGIIHGDIKPDNFLIKDIPNISSTASTPAEIFANSPSTLKLIDFGRSIDMEEFPEGTTFTEVVTTDKFTCCEMRGGQEWTYQIDLYGVAAIAHLFLFGSYMEVKKTSYGKWDISGVTLKRYWQKELWQELFTTLLNVPSCSAIPNLTHLKERFMTTFCQQGLHKQMNTKFSSLLITLSKRK